MRANAGNDAQLRLKVGAFNVREGHIWGFVWSFASNHCCPSVAAAALAATIGAASAEDTVKVGLIVPLTGGQASTGKQIDNAIKLYQQQNGATVAGKKVEVIVKDDGAVPDNTKRIAQELIVNDKVSFIAGFGVTPAALAAAPLATQAKVPEIVMAAAPRSSPSARPISCAPRSRWRSPRPSSATGRRRTASRRSRRWSPITRRAPTR